MLLNGERNITYAITRNCLFNALIQRFLGNTNELGSRRSGIANRESISVVSVKSVFVYTDIYGNNISFLQLVFIRKAMHHDIID